jgi:hypothetical protein
MLARARKTAFVQLDGGAYNGPLAMCDSQERLATIARRAGHVIRRAQGKGIAVVLSVRPKVAELLFQLYGRPLHPELFQVCQTHRVQRGDYEAKIDITTAGHVVTWRYRGLTLTEVATSSNQPLPERRRLMSYRLRGERIDRVECRCNVAYDMSFQLEPVDPEVFWTFQHELARDGERQGLFHQFKTSGRISMGAISYINFEARNRNLLIQAFHTFPEDCAIVKSQSLFQLP